MVGLQAHRKRKPDSKTTKLQRRPWHAEAARLYTRPRRTTPGVSLRATAGASHSARQRHYFPAGCWAPSSPSRNRAAFQLLPVGSSGAEVAARRCPLDGTGFVLSRVLVAGNPVTSCRDAMGLSRRRLGLSALGPEADFRFPPSAEALFPEATHRSQGRFVCAAEPRPSRLPGLEEPSRGRGLHLVCAQSSGSDSNYRSPSPFRVCSLGFVVFSCSKIL